MSKAKVWLMPNGTRDQVSELLLKGDEDAIKELIKEGKLIVVDADAKTDTCGNVIHATFKYNLAD